MPEGTIYCKYSPCYFGNLSCKAQNMGDDFVTQEWVANIEHDSSEDFTNKCERMEKGEDVSLDFDFFGRDGLYEKNQLFAVYSRKDVEDLIKALQTCLLTHAS